MLYSGFLEDILLFLPLVYIFGKLTFLESLLYTGTIYTTKTHLYNYQYIRISVLLY
uniref:Uncharacterized protein n=1 Tax=Octopus bimaculoides TaxID=37653 RepID=A0A0L8H5Z1_OCTBM